MGSGSPNVDERRRGQADASPNLAGIPHVGDVLAGKYRVERLIGTGGMGVVLAVKHHVLGERFAVKCLLPKAADGAAKQASRFLREARAAARIKSEHICQVSDIGELADGSPFLVMEHLDGADLAAVLEKRGPLPPTEAVDYVLQACAGIAEAHAIGIIHRDLKPSNLFLTERSDGTPLVKVLDFGIAKAVDPERDAVAVTETTGAFGSPSYMSPEQIRSSKNVDFRTDVWSLGIILYELVSGQRPFDGETPLAVLAAITADDPPPLRSLCPEVPPELDSIVLRCLEKDVGRRFASVSELAAALAAFASGRVVSLGRIQRLARTPDAPPTARARTSNPASTVDGAATTLPMDPPIGVREARGRARWLLAALGVVVVVGAAGTGYVARGARTLPATAPSVVATSAIATGATATGATATGATATVSPSTTTTTGKMPSTSTSTMGGRAGRSVRAKASASAPVPTPSKAPEVPIDPTAYSH